VRTWLRGVAQEKKHWAGIPMPLEGEQLVIEPTYPNAEALMKIGAPTARVCTSRDVDDANAIVGQRNAFWSTAKRCTIHVLDLAGGKVTWGLVPGVHHATMDLHTLGCADAWGLEQEWRAMETFRSLVSERQYMQYVLTGAFLESSARSHVTYMFRRLKPTVALNAHGKGATVRIMCALCLHPIAYYSGTWAGAMCPTDDVLAHLMLMRGDEAMFWRRANQHAPHLPEAGL
jgi:hypothetical protein